MRTRLIITGICNIIDLVATLYLTSIGGKELNPVMALLLNWPPLAVVVKLGVMTWALVTMWQYRENETMIRISWFAMILYLTIAIYYAVFFGILFCV